MLQTDVVFQDRYRIQCEVGRGSFGIVYAAEDLQTGQTVAVKVLLPWTRSNGSLRHRLKREAKLTRLLKSPHAVRILDLQEIPGGDLYIAMEFLSGEVLSQVLRRENDFAAAGRRDRPANARRVRRIPCDGRDPSRPEAEQHLHLPQSPMAPTSSKCSTSESPKSRARRTALGLAETTRLTSPGGVLGTPPYMSPEQCCGESLTPASDFYSLGIVLYELVTGQFPSTTECRASAGDAQPAPMPPLPSGFASSALGRAIMQSLEKDPRARFRSAAEFTAAIMPAACRCQSAERFGAECLGIAGTARMPRRIRRPEVRSQITAAFSAPQSSLDPLRRTCAAICSPS